MTTENQLKFLLIFIVVNVFCPVLVNCCDDDHISLPSCATTEAPPPPPNSKCDPTKKGVCVCDPHCTKGINNVITWQQLSECDRQRLKAQRTKEDKANYIFFGNVNEAKCIELNKKKIGIFGCCQKTQCSRRGCCPAGIQNYPFNCGAA